MLLKFSKYQGTGNDFVIIDNRDTLFSKSNARLIRHICSRRFGVGADGLMLLEKCEGYDFFMRYYNADGNESSMCGNGGRCIVSFAKQIGVIKDTDTALFLAADGEHTAKITPRGLVSLQMNPVEHVERGEAYFYLDTGSPHYVKLVENREGLNTFELGRAIRYNERFSQKGTNVNFLTIRPNKLIVSTYERGVENETFSCGTGVVASAISASIIEQKTDAKYAVLTKGGTLNVRLKNQDNRFTDIWLEGATKHVFEGAITIAS